VNYIGGTTRLRKTINSQDLDEEGDEENGVEVGKTRHDYSKIGGNSRPLVFTFILPIHPHRKSCPEDGD
jgi:hypothetical protein